MPDPFEALLEGLVSGSSHQDLMDSDAPAFPRELGLTPSKVLGRGSMGWVFLAHDEALDREVAVKVARPERGQQARDALLHEARTTARLAHPAVLPVHRVFQSARTVAIVFRLAPKLTLFRLLHGDQTHLLRILDTNGRIALLLQGTGAIAHAHALGIVHGDIHPANVALGPSGEPYVLDWGGLRTEHGAFSGHPGYAAPEQLHGAGPSPASDVFACCAVIYEAITGTTYRPRLDGERLGDWIARVRSDTPTLRAIGEPTLDALLVAGLQTDPAARPTMEQVVRTLQEILSGATERARRREESLRLLAGCRDGLEEYGDLTVRLAAEQRVAAVQRTKTPPWAATHLKRPLWETESRVKSLMIEQEICWVTAAENGMRSLALAPDNDDARRALADLWWARFRQAEAGTSPAEIAMAMSRLSQLDDGRYERQLSAPAYVTLDCNVPGATVTVHRFETRDRRNVAVAVAQLDLPLRRHTLTPGSWLLEIEAPGHAPAPYPLALRRREHHRNTVTLHSPQGVGEGWVYMPGGPFHMGGDPMARMIGWRVGGRGPLRGFATGGDPLARRALESCQPTIGSRFVLQTPVTSAEYLAFLNDLDQEQAQLRAPGEAGLYGSVRPFWAWDPEAGWRLPADWDPSWPVMAVSLYDAQDYAAWRSAREGRAMRLPTEEEWEKAARGVDGRPFPWGQSFDPTFAHMRRSRPGRPTPCPVGQYPVDRSVWGTLDMAGCIREWTNSLFDEGQVVVRGGSWSDDEDELRCASRIGLDPAFRYSFVGFRLVSEEPASVTER